MTEPRIRASAILLKKHQIALIHRHNHGREYWVLPGGGIDLGETAEQAVAREVNEETGLTVTSSRLVFYVNRFDEPEINQPCFVCEFIGENLSFTGPEIGQDPENLFEAKWVDIKLLPTLLIYPQMVKAKLLGIL